MDICTIHILYLNITENHKQIKIITKIRQTEFPRPRPHLPLSLIGLLEEEVKHAGGGDAVVGLEVPEEALRLLAEDAMLITRSCCGAGMYQVAL